MNAKQIILASLCVGASASLRASSTTPSAAESDISQADDKKPVDLGWLYKLLSFRGKSWNLLANGSDDEWANAMNVAFPNFGTQYLCTTFGDATQFTISGSFPASSSGVRYAALTVYDTGGNIMGDEASASINFMQPEYANAKPFQKTFECSGPCIVLYRIYRPADQLDEVLRANLKVSVTASGQELPEASLTEATITGKMLQPLMQRALGRGMGQSGYVIAADTAMFKPPSAAVPGLFVNANAKYLLTKMADSTDCLVFRGRTPIPDANSSSAKNSSSGSGGIRFYGFMAVDMRSTATLSSVDYGQMGGWGRDYELFVCRGQAYAEARGYKEGTPGQYYLHAAEPFEEEKPWSALFPLSLPSLFGKSNTHGKQQQYRKHHKHGQQQKHGEQQKQKQGERLSVGVILREINTGTCEGAAVAAQGCGGLWDPSYYSDYGSEEWPGLVSAEGCRAAMGQAYPVIEESKIESHGKQTETVA